MRLSSDAELKAIQSYEDRAPEKISPSPQQPTTEEAIARFSHLNLPETFELARQEIPFTRSHSTLYQPPPPPPQEETARTTTPPPASHLASSKKERVRAPLPPPPPPLPPPPKMRAGERTGEEPEIRAAQAARFVPAGTVRVVGHGPPALNRRQREERERAVAAPAQGKS